MDKRKIIKHLVLLLCLLSWTATLPAQEPKIGLALSGGGAKSISQIGVLQVIDSLQIPIDMVSGTSMGSVVGALYACGYSGQELEELFLQTNWQELFDESISRQDFSGSKKRWKPFASIYLHLTDNFRPVLPGGILYGSHITNKFFDMTYHAYDIRDFSQLPIPFFCKATDLYQTKSTILDKGYLHTALRASISLPSVFTPITLDSSTYVDGGLLDNFPTKDLLDKKMDIIIGVKTTFQTQKEEEENLISVLNKSIGVNINNNVRESEKYVSILIYPKLEEKTFLLDFENLSQQIAAGKKEALTKIAQLKTLSNPEKFTQLKAKKQKFKSRENSFHLEKIKIKGNQHLEDKTIFSIANLRKENIHSKEDVVRLCKQLYDTDYFEYCYPLLSRDSLAIVVKEKLRQKVGFYANYNDYTNLSLGALLKIDNRIWNNSNFLANLEFGNKTEVDLDFVKNFGNRWGAYLRTFASYKQQDSYIYNKSEFATTTKQSKEETNITLGIGMYTNKSTILEGYYFYYLSDFEENQEAYGIKDKTFYTNGLGIKVYYEYLDDSYIPMDGESILSKFHFSNQNLKSEADYQKFSLKYKKLIPFVKDRFSLKVRLDYGNLSSNSSLPIEHDPFYLGGIDNFLGFETNSILAPVYKLGYLGFRTRFYKYFYWDLGANFADLREKDYWNIFEEKYSTYQKGCGTTLTYYNPLFISRLGVAINDESETSFYFSFGYNFDSFEFSKK